MLVFLSELTCNDLCLFLSFLPLRVQLDLLLLPTPFYLPLQGPQSLVHLVSSLPVHSLSERLRYTRVYLLDVCARVDDNFPQMSNLPCQSYFVSEYPSKSVLTTPHLGSSFSMTRLAVKYIALRESARVMLGL